MNYQFTGQRYDESSDLLYYGARYYDAALGRFIQPDTIIPDSFNPQSLNRYSYTLNNPLRYTDPTGHMQACMLDDDCEPDPDPVSPPSNPVVEPHDDDLCPDAHMGAGCDNSGQPETEKPEHNQDQEDSAWKCLLNPSCLGDLLIPSHFGLGWNFQIGGGFIPILEVLAIGFNFNVGGMMVYNRHSGEFGSSINIGGQLGVQGTGGSASLTGGPVFGWGAPSLDPILTGYSANGDVIECAVL